MTNQIKLGLKENAFQFSLLIIVNAFVGAMIGLERSILPSIAEVEFHLAAKTAILSFIIVFGLTKAFMNYFAGRLSDLYGRKVVLIGGWLIAIPVPFLLMWAPSWSWVLFANALLGISQGLTWSTTVIMKIDLAGAKQRGLAMGLNEFAGYFAVAGSALATGYIASHFGLRPAPFYLGIAYVALGLFLSVFLVRETKEHVQLESVTQSTASDENITQGEVFLNTTFSNKNLSSVTQAGFVNNLNDGMAWGLFPIFFATAGVSLEKIAWLAAIYPATWGIFQLGTGYLSDKLGRKWLIASGMWVQALGIAMTVLSNGFFGFALGGVLLGVGTAMVYPTLLAAIGDVAHPKWRASSVGVYRLWRDLGYAAGAVVAGVTADVLGLDSAIWLVAIITACSGFIVAFRMSETLEKKSEDCIEPDLVREKIKCQKILIVDVRSEDEFKSGHIEGAVNLPITELPAKTDILPKDVLIVTVCGRGGGRSERAANLLLMQGLKNVRWLCGGYLKWSGLGSCA
jgi:MFS family permease